MLNDEYLKSKKLSNKALAVSIVSLILSIAALLLQIIVFYL